MFWLELLISDVNGFKSLSLPVKKLINFNFVKVTATIKGIKDSYFFAPLYSC
jgi:DNA-binding transcriptional regulator GbsR (MarR family)